MQLFVILVDTTILNIISFNGIEQPLGMKNLFYLSHNLYSKQYFKK